MPQVGDMPQRPWLSQKAAEWPAIKRSHPRASSRAPV